MLRFPRVKASIDISLSNLSKLAFYLSVFTFPLQLNKYFWPESAYVLGIPIDLLAQAIYLSDIFIILFITTFPFSSFNSLIRFAKKNKALIFSLIFFSAYYTLGSAVNFSQTAVFKAAKFWEFSLFAIFAAQLLENKNDLLLFRKTLISAAIMQLFVIVMQFIYQGSLGLALIGERSLNSAVPGLAKVTFFGKELLRSYGTFPHPNVAAAFFLFTFIVEVSPRKFTKEKFTLLITGLGLILTFSKSAQAMFLFSIIYLLKSFRLKILVLLVSLIPLLFILMQALTFQIASISERLSLVSASIEIVKETPFFGIGPGNFISKLSTLNIFSLREVRLLQPVHNIFLLTFVENGILGLTALVSIFALMIPKLRDKTSILLFVFLILFASFDHFFLTLHQGMFLFFLSIALVFASPKAHSS